MRYLRSQAVWVFIIGIAMSMGQPVPRAYAQVHEGAVVGKSCSACRRLVPLASEAGQVCPHCGAYWGYEQREVVTSDQIAAQPAVRDEPTSRKRPGSGSPPVGTTGVQSSNGTYTAEPTGNGTTIRILNALGHHILTLPHSGDLRTEMFSPAEDAIVTIDRNGGCAVYELPWGVRRAQMSRAGTLSAMFLPNMGDCVMLFRPDLILFRDARTNQLLNSGIRISSSSKFAEVIVNQDEYGTRLFTLDILGRTSVWDIETAKRLVTNGPGSVAVQPNNATHPVAVR